MLAMMQTADRIRSVLLTLLALSLAACSSTQPFTVCTDLEQVGLFVSVVDSASNAAAEFGATISAVRTEDDYSVSRTLPDSEGGMFQVFEHPGTYDLTVTKPAYKPWSRWGIIVPIDAQGCHAVPTHVTAKLVSS
jgi:hypothetical protein